MTQPLTTAPAPDVDAPIDLWPTPAADRLLGRSTYQRARGLAITPAGLAALERARVADPGGRQRQCRRCRDVYTPPPGTPDDRWSDLCPSCLEAAR